MEGAPFRRVVIAGRDAALWLTANVIHAALSRQGVAVEVVELPTLLRTQDVYATLPAMEALHHLLGIDESQLLTQTRGAFTLGQRFGDVDGQSNFFHPYGGIGAPIGGLPFFQCWLKARNFGLSVALEDFSLTAAAAMLGRMVVPDRETTAFARTDYGYHLPAAAYAGFLKALAVRRGVKASRTARLQVDLDPETGRIGTLGLDGGRMVSGDLFIDATGAEALLIGAGLGVARETWRARFPCDRVLSVGGAPFEPIPVFAQIRAVESGWIGFYPTQAGTGLLTAYNSARLSDEAALHKVAQTARLGEGEAFVSATDPGRRRAWERNCIAIGEAACVFDPVHNVELQAVQLGVVHLLSLFPVSYDYAAEQAEYNRLIEESFDRVCDFQQAYYALNRYGSSPFWADARQAPMSAALRRKVETFAARGDIPMLDGESFSVESWQCLLLGCGCTPDSHNPQIDLLPAELMKQGFRSILSRVKLLVEKQASHESYLELFCS